MTLKGENKPTLQPLLMEPPKYGTNYRQSAVIAQNIEAQKHNEMIGGKHIIPNLHTGVKPTIMSTNALTGTANSTLQIQENGKYDQFDPSKPIHVKTGGKTHRKKRTKKHKKKTHKRQHKKHHTRHHKRQHKKKTHKVVRHKKNRKKHNTRKQKGKKYFKL